MKPVAWTLHRALPILLVLALDGPSQARLRNPIVQPVEEESTEEAPNAKVPYSFNDVASCIVIIKCRSETGRWSGSGFVAQVDGKTYIYTNQHVIMGADQIEFRTVNGEDLKPSTVELSRERDIARLVIADREEALAISSNLAIDAPLAVFGNSEGGGVATELYGKVTGVTSDLVEVSAEFVSGNSGSPVLNAEKEVIGIASYVQFSSPSEDSDEKDKSRFESKVRRFCYRLTNVEWFPVNWRPYNDKYGKPYVLTQSTFESVVAIINGCIEDPLERVPSDGYRDIGLTSWSTTHNKMVDRLNIIRKQGFTQTQWKKLRNEYYDSAHGLANIAHRHAMKLAGESDDAALSGFLKAELDSYAYNLEYASRVIDYVGKTVAESD